METINTIKNAATKAIWGDEAAHQEPVSGKTGDVSKGEPYDAGNIEPAELNAKNEATAVDETGTQPVESGTSKKPNAAITSSSDDGGSNSSTTSDSNDTEQNQQPPKINPSTTQGSSLSKDDSTPGQNDVRDPEDPATHHGNAQRKNDVDDASGSGGLDLGTGSSTKTMGPDTIVGPGPRPLAQVAKEHGGDAGAIAATKGNDKGKGGGTEMHKVDTQEDEDNGGSGNGSGIGTGELHVRSSGLKADGGDFDASAPGAGREADRLLEEKGVHHDGPNGGVVSNGKGNGNGSSSPSKEKTSLKAKIKQKLHRTSAASASSA